MSDQAKYIMVVDDEAVNRELLEDMLVPLGYHVFQAATGETALQLVRELSPDVILLDIMMPNMDGIEVTRRLRQDEKTSDIPIVMVTALKEAANRVKALEAEQCRIRTWSGGSVCQMGQTPPAGKFMPSW